MALDSKHKRGSAMSITIPFRPWLSEPAGTIDSTQRLSLLKMCGATVLTITGEGRLEFTIPKHQLTYTLEPERPEFTLPKTLDEFSTN